MLPVLERGNEAGPIREEGWEKSYVHPKKQHYSVKVMWSSFGSVKTKGW